MSKYNLPDLVFVEIISSTHEISLWTVGHSLGLVLINQFYNNQDSCKKSKQINLRKPNRHWFGDLR